MTPAAPDKQLFPLDLSKGMDERTRPELMSGAQAVTSIINMEMDQTGAWVKRKGTYRFGASDNSGTGTYPANVKKIVPFTNGWGLIADGGKLLHKKNGYPGTFRTREMLMEFSPDKSNIVAGSTVRDASGTNGVGVLGFASGTNYDVTLMQAFRSTTSQTYTVSLCERSTGSEIVYSFTLNNTTLAYTYTEPTMCITAGTYVSIFCQDGQRTLKCYTINLNSLPASSTLSSPTTIYTTTNAPGYFSALGGDGTKCWFCFDDSSATNGYIAEVTASSGAVGTVYTATGLYARGFANLAYDGTYLYGVVRTGVATWSVRKITASTMTLSTSWSPGRAIDTLVWANSQLYGIVATTATLGSGTSNTIEVSTIAAGASAVVVGAMYGWVPFSHPFYCSETGKVYVHAVKKVSNSTNSPHAIISLSDFTPYQTNGAGLALPYGAFRVACMLDAHLGATYDMCGYGGVAQGHGIYYNCSSGALIVCVPHMTGARSAAVAAVRLRPTCTMGYSNARFGNGVYIAHGGLNQYDGVHVFCNGLPGLPEANVQTVASAGNLNGSYNYCVVYRHVDSNGETTWSRVAGPIAISNVSGSTGKNTITVAPPGATNKENGTRDFSVMVDVYRTQASGNIYYLVGSSAYLTSANSMTQNATTGLLTFTDNDSDTTISTRPLMFRHPGVQNTPLDRYPAPCTNIVIHHKDRLFCVDMHGLRVYYSSFFVDGETPWFNPLFSFYCHGGSGPITGLASMDGRLFIFKRDAIFVVDGDGPTESQPTGAEWSPPQMIPTVFGCVDYRSISTTEHGIVFRSSRGFELLGRGLQQRWIGDRVMNTAELYPVTTDVCVDSGGSVRWAVAANESYSGTSGYDGVELVWNYLSDIWSLNKYNDASGNYGRALQNIAEVDDGGTVRTIRSYGDGSGSFGDVAYGADVFGATARTVPATLETGWLRMGPQVRQRISTILALLKRQDNHKVTISLAFDYVDSYTHVVTWEPDVLNTLDIEELVVKPSKPQTLAIKMKIEIARQTDTGTYPVGSELFADLLNITMEASPLPNAPFGNRGTAGSLSVPPRLSAVTPATGSTAGGTAITIYGVDFDANTKFYLNNVVCTSIVIVSSRKATAVTPAAGTGVTLVDLKAANGGGSDTLSSAFTYT